MLVSLISLLLVGGPSSALAGDLFLNGVKVDPTSLSEVRFEDVTVRFDVAGNIMIDAPQYSIEVMNDEPVAAPPDPAVREIELTTESKGPVPKESWWFVTEDNNSTGHQISVTINGEPVTTVRSGDLPRLMDLGQYLHRGTNSVQLESTSSGAGGGTLYVYVGGGANVAGTVTLETPQIQLNWGPTKSGSELQERLLKVP
jgi:hypothetical protein